jgi:DNA processing protein
MSGSDAARSLPSQAYLVALAGLPRMGPIRLRALLAGDEPEAAWARVRQQRLVDVPGVVEALEGDGPGLLERWALVAGRTDVATHWRRHRDAGIEVLDPDSPGWPAVLVPDPDPPSVLFASGDLGALDGICVAVVGTRRCTQYGRDVASDLGRGLAAAGVRVVSGLALGIDAAAHAGALAAVGAPVVGVVGNGLDVHYPRRNASLYAQVAARGVLLSEYPLGTQPRRWTFPARNRLIAAFSRMVVVVESHVDGGSLHTVDEADRRDIEVRAVPGSVRSPASAGTNALIDGGRAVVRDELDVLLPLGLTPAQEGRVRGAAGSTADPDERDLRPQLRRILDALGWEPASLEQVLLRTQLGLSALHEGLAELEDGGWLTWDGNWVERRARGPRS